MSILKKEITETIKPSGCIISREIYDKTKEIKWAFRDNPVNETDSGWRLFAKTEDKNLIIVDEETITKIEPIFEKIKDYPIGTDLELKKDEAGKFFIDNKTKQRIWF